MSVVSSRFQVQLNNHIVGPQNVCYHCYLKVNPLAVGFWYQCISRYLEAYTNSNQQSVPTFSCLYQPPDYNYDHNDVLVILADFF